MDLEISPIAGIGNKIQKTIRSRKLLAVVQNTSYSSLPSVVARIYELRNEVDDKPSVHIPNLLVASTEVDSSLRAIPVVKNIKQALNNIPIPFNSLSSIQKLLNCASTLLYSFVSDEIENKVQVLLGSEKEEYFSIKLPDSYVENQDLNSLYEVTQKQFSQALESIRSHYLQINLFQNYYGSLTTESMLQEIASLREENTRLNLKLLPKQNLASPDPQAEYLNPSEIIEKNGILDIHIPLTNGQFLLISSRKRVRVPSTNPTDHTHVIQLFDSAGDRITYKTLSPKHFDLLDCLFLLKAKEMQESKNKEVHLDYVLEEDSLKEIFQSVGSSTNNYGTKISRNAKYLNKVFSEFFEVNAAETSFVVSYSKKDKQKSITFNIPQIIFQKSLSNGD
ncbi:MAG: hypothetical protein QNJ31_00550 [Candidatus Caenarcaniphilales bacterium]|nr:hypothetical protein [Candidatus Caenarcaniphilales bacterium]